MSRVNLTSINILNTYGFWELAGQIEFPETFFRGKEGKNLVISTKEEEDHTLFLVWYITMSLIMKSTCLIASMSS